MNDEQAVTQGNLADQMAQNKANKDQVNHLQKKIDGFSNNQSEVSISSIKNLIMFV